MFKRGMRLLLLVTCLISRDHLHSAGKLRPSFSSSTPDLTVGSLERASAHKKSQAKAANTSKCPKAQTSSLRPVLFATNHKTGTFLSYEVKKRLCSAIDRHTPCLPCSKGDSTVRRSYTKSGKKVIHLSRGSEPKISLGEDCCGIFSNIHWSGEPPWLDDHRILNFARNPYEVVVSGFLYHLHAPKFETFAHVRLGAKANETDRLDEHDRAGFLAVAAAVSKGRLPEARPEETYELYLQRLDPNVGLKAEFIRASARDLPYIVWAARNASQSPRALTICLDDAMNNEVDWENVVDFLGVTQATAEERLALVTSMAQVSSNPRKSTKHATDHGAVFRSELRKKTVLVGGAELRLMESEVGCAGAGYIAGSDRS